MAVPHKLTPIYSSTEPTEDAKATGRLSPAAGSVVHLDDDGDVPVSLHLGFIFTMFMCFVLNVIEPWMHLGDWRVVLIDAIVFLYSTVMMNLLLIKRRNKQHMQRELACKEIVISTPRWPLLTSVLMLSATAVMLVAMGVAVFVFHLGRFDLAVVAFSVLFSTALMFLLLKIEEIQRKNRLRAKYGEVASDLI